MRHTFLFISLLLSFFFSFSQDDKLVKKGDKLFEEHNYFQALRYYEEAWNQKKEDPYLNFRIAKCYLETFQKGKALQFASDAVKYSEKPSNEMYFILASAYHSNLQFDKAIEAYQKSDPGRTNQKRIS